MSNKNIEEKLILLLNHQSIPTERYLGQLQDTDNLIVNKLPIVFVDFVQETPVQNGMSKKLHFALYIVHISYSSNPLAKKETNDTLFDLIDNIDDTLRYKQMTTDCEPLLLDRLVKIADKKSSKGYITIYKRDVSTIAQSY